MPQEKEILLMNGVMAWMGHGSRGQVENGSKARGLWVRGTQVSVGSAPSRTRLFRGLVEFAF